VYLTGLADSVGTQIHWLLRDGKTQLLHSRVSNHINLRFSPDGQQIAFEAAEQQVDVYRYDWKRDSLSRLTFDPMQDQRPVWSPDSRRIAFGSQRSDKATSNIFWQRADGTGEPQRLTESKNHQYPMSFHPKGKYLAISEVSPQTNYDILILPIDGDESSGWKPGKPSPFLATFFQEREPAFSPDGRWLAYQGNENVVTEVYVVPYPGPGGKWQVSAGGGEFPTWSPNGKELFYRTRDSKMMVVNYVSDGDTFRLTSKPALWSDVSFADRGPLNRNFDLHPDGQRFAVLRTTEQQSGNVIDRVTFTFNFFDELRRLARPW
jgi:serine/threonine-protein kinase